MKYDELEKTLQSRIAFSETSDEEMLDHFEHKFDKVLNEDGFVYVFHHNREFENKNHIISLHQRTSGKVPMHIFHYIVMTYVYAGTLEITVENETILLHAGECIILDKHVSHSVGATSEKDLGVNIILHEHYFSNRFINKLPPDQLLTQFMTELMNHQHPHTHYLLFHTSDDFLIHNCIQNILCEHFDHMLSSNDIIDSYIMILITHLSRKGQYNTNLSVTMFKNQSLLDEIMLYIQTNYQDGSLINMCKHFGYDPSYTSKLIKRFTLRTFKQLVNEERMKKAIALLQNKELPIYQIAQEVGIQNLTAFYKRFQEFTNLTPQEFRNQKK